MKTGRAGGWTRAFGENGGNNMYLYLVCMYVLSTLLCWRGVCFRPQIRNIDITMADRHIKNGKLNMGFKKLNDKDFEWILQKLSQPRHREWCPRKYRKLDGVGAVLAMLPPPVPLYYLNAVGNTQVSDAGMKHLHLVNDSVIDFDLSQCGLTAKGTKLLCEFLKTNTSMTLMIMWGNNIGDEGAKYISEMLQVNMTIRELPQ